MNGGPALDPGRLAAWLEAPAPVVSLYAPLEPEQRDLRAPEARLRELADQAEQLLGALDATARDALVARLRDTLDRDLAEHRDAGLAVLLAADRTELIPLPEPPPELVVVGPHAHLKPLLPLLARNRRFHILALSADRARLLTATPWAWQERALTELPPEAQAELDSRPASDTDSLERARMALLTQDPHRVAHAVRAALAGDDAAVVLAAEPRIAGHFTKLADLPGLLPQIVQVNPFALDDAALHARAMQVIGPLIDAELEAVLEQLEARLGAGDARLALRLEEILAAANEGRVDTVVVAEDTPVWGSCRPGQTITAHGHPVPGDEDLVNLAAIATLRTGGRAFAVPRERLPLHAPAAALLRF